MRGGEKIDTWTYSSQTLFSSLLFRLFAGSPITLKLYNTKSNSLSLCLSTSLFLSRATRASFLHRTHFLCYILTLMDCSALLFFFLTSCVYSFFFRFMTSWMIIQERAFHDLWAERNTGPWDLHVHVNGVSFDKAEVKVLITKPESYLG